MSNVKGQEIRKSESVFGFVLIFKKELMYFKILFYIFLDFTVRIITIVHAYLYILHMPNKNISKSTGFVF